MLLYRSFEEQGSLLFKYRGYFPVLLFLAVVPYMLLRDTPPLEGWTRTLLSTLSVIIAAAGVLFRAWTIGQTPEGTSGRNTEAQKAKVLNTTGVYSIHRHPLYFGNFLIWTGIVLFSFEASFILITWLLFWLFYERIMYTEERFLEREFGTSLKEWAEKVPAFFPRPSAYVPNVKPFSIKKVLRKEYSGLLATVVGFVHIGLLRDLLQEGGSIKDPFWWTVLGTGALITLTLRTLHHKSSLLKDKA